MSCCCFLFAAQSLLGASKELVDSSLVSCLLPASKHALFIITRWFLSHRYPPRSTHKSFLDFESSLSCFFLIVHYLYLQGDDPGDARDVEETDGHLAKRTSIMRQSVVITSEIVRKISRRMTNISTKIYNVLDVRILSLLPPLSYHSRHTRIRTPLSYIVIVRAEEGITVRVGYDPPQCLGNVPQVPDT